MLKALPGRILHVWAQKLPPVLRRVLLDSMLEVYGRPAVFRELAKEMHVSGFIVSGMLGPVCGGAEDTTTLPAYMQAGTWQLGMQFLYTTFFIKQKGGTYIGVGANVGLATIPIARQPGVTCYVFEPSSRNFAYLVRNLEVNCPPHSVYAHQIALLDEPGTVTLELSSGNLGDHRVRTGRATGELSESSWRTEQVPAGRLDDVLDLARLKLPIAIRIDTQGSSARVVAGGIRTITAADMVAVDFWPYGMQRVGGDVEGMLTFLEQNFREACIRNIDQEVPPDWRPIAKPIGEMRDLWAKRATLGYGTQVELVCRK